MLDVRLNTPLTLDPKGRITLPSRVKAQLDHVGTNQLVCIAHREHLRLYTKADFKEYVEKPLLGLDGFDPEVERKQRLRLGFAVEVAFDPQGRFVVPPNLRELAGLQRDVVLISMAERLELWDEPRLRAWLRAEMERG
ncbi:MAG: division/cell wall cluster transcriptional repressor MraZ [Myxococcota bacterium]